MARLGVGLCRAHPVVYLLAVGSEHGGSRWDCGGVEGTGCPLWSGHSVGPSTLHLQVQCGRQLLGGEMAASSVPEHHPGSTLGFRGIPDL